MAQRIYLSILGAILLVVGVVALINPSGAAEAVGIAAIDIAGQSEIRAIYGGLPIGWGALLLAGLRYPNLAVAGLAFTALGGGGILLARFFSALSMGAAGFTGAVTTLILVEVVMVAFAYILLRRVLQGQDEPDVIR